MKILIIDNYDSFTYNLVQIIRKITNEEPVVKRNDCFAMKDVEAFSKIVLSPGPGIPREAGNIIPLIDQFASSKSILGICLGHQAIGEAFGASLKKLENVFHGVKTPISICNNNTVFRNIESVIDVGRYHSWVVDPENLPADLEVLAYDSDDNIMALKHRKHNVLGLQFHPESILTPQGEQIIYNWIHQ